MKNDVPPMPKSIYKPDKLGMAYRSLALAMPHLECAVACLTLTDEQEDAEIVFDLARRLMSKVQPEIFTCS